MISFWLLALLFTGSVASAQNAATQQQIDRLSGQIQDLTESQARFNQRLDAIERSLNDLRDKASTPVVNDYASRAELKQLIADLRQIDQKRKEDSENIARQLQNLAKVAAGAPPPPRRHPTGAKRPFRHRQYPRPDPLQGQERR
jgi:septal ring factor EnvC (AmiA/AmiB activator)